jgi:hypothetical protein
MAIKKEAAACEYLGAGIDPTVSFGFASPNNYCYHASPPEAIRLSHQERVCLPANFKNCPVYQPDWHGPLPQEISANPQGSRRGMVYFAALIIGVGVVLLMLWYASTLVFTKNRLFLPAIQSYPKAFAHVQESLTVTSTAVPTPASLIFPTNTQILPSATLTAAVTPLETLDPTETSIPTETHTPTTIACAPPADWVAYTVQPGDSLALFRKIYNLRKIELLAFNCIPTQEEVSVGQIFYLPYLPPTKIPASNNSELPVTPPEERLPEPPPSRP